MKAKIGYPLLSANKCFDVLVSTLGEGYYHAKQ